MPRLCAAHLPRAYLAHIGPTDDGYLDDALARTFLGSRRTRYLYEMTTRIKHFDVVPNELKNVRFVVVATHGNSIAGILETLLDQGIDLAQVRFMYDTEADFANVSFDQRTNSVEAEWIHYTAPGTSTYSLAVNHLDLASLLKKKLP